MAEPFGAPVVPGREPLDPDARRARAAELFPHLRRIASADRRQVGHFTDSEVVLDFLSREKLPQLVALGTSCPDHFLRTKVRPLLLDTAVDAPIDEVVARLADLHAEYREEYAGYYDRHATPESPAMRGADPAIVLVPGVGHVLLRRRQADRQGGRRVLRQRDQRDARRRGRVDLLARSTRRRSSASSTGSSRRTS